MEKIMNPDDVILYERNIFEKVFLRMVKSLPDSTRYILSQAELASHYEAMALSMVHELRLAVASSKPQEEEWVAKDYVTYPVDWKNALRDRFVPKRWKRLRAKVQYRTVPITYTQNIRNICPHLGIASPDPHIDFLRMLPTKAYEQGKSEQYRPVVVTKQEYDRLVEYMAYFLGVKDLDVPNLLNILGLKYGGDSDEEAR